MMISLPLKLMFSAYVPTATKMVSPLDVLACSMAYCIVLNGLPDEPSPLVSDPALDTLIWSAIARVKLRMK